MTREAKIGMLTGLSVIVLIGVLLSSYLGNGTGPMLAGTSRMAPLPAGEAYRQQLLQPMGVPAPAPGPKTQLANGTEVVTPIDTNNGMAPLPAMVADMAPGAPVVGPAVLPLPAGPVTVNRDFSGPPTIELADPSKMIEARFRGTPAPDAPQATPAPAPAMQSVSYEIAAGDNLAKIAKKFYNSAKNSDIARIVKANPDQLKDASSTLIAGKKLNVPNVPTKAPTPTPPTGSHVNLTKTDGPLVAMNKGTIIVPLPGDVGFSAQQKAAAQLPATPPTKPVDASKTYVVKAGDSLRQIAATIAGKSGGGVSDTMKKLQTINNISNPDSLKVGTPLKLP